MRPVFLFDKVQHIAHLLVGFAGLDFPQSLDKQQQQVRLQLSLTLLAVISQRLVRAKDGGRVAAREILINTPAVANLIREGETAQIPSVIQTGAEFGMRTMGQSLKELAAQGVIDPDMAYEKVREEEGGADYQARRK